MKRLLLNLLWPVFTCALSAQVASVSPQPGTCSALLDANIVITLAAPSSSPDIRVNSRMRGRIAGTPSATGNIWTFDPAVDFLPGEELEVSLPAFNYTWRFNARTKAVTPLFDHYKHLYNSGTAGETYALRCGDMNGDGHIDVVQGRLNGPNHIYFNDGSGQFPQVVAWGGSTDQVQDLALADVDRDGDLDMVVAINPGRNLLYLNPGNGQFSTPIQLSATDTSTIAVAAGDLDGDGDLDIVFSNGGISSLADEIYYNDGTGLGWTAGIIDVYPGTNSPMAHNSWDVALGDIDRDGDLDIVLAVFELFGSARSVIYFNDGQGGFSQYRMVGSQVVENYKYFGYADQNLSVALGDLDGDGDLDIALGTNGGTVSDPRLACLWQNDGTGTMTLYGQTGMFTSEYDQTWHCQFVDFDGDYDWDLGITNSNYVVSQFSHSWRTQTLCNTGGGAYVNGYGVGYLTDAHYAMDYADMDGDGDLDMVLRDWLHLNGSTPSMINVQAGSNWLTDGDTVNVAYNATLASLNMHILVSDPDSTTIDVAGAFSNVTTQGLLDAEISASGAAVPCNLYPAAGTFNVGSVTHTVTLTADDGFTQTVFTFYIAVGAVPPPVLAVSEPAGPVNHGSGASGGRDFGTRDAAAGPTSALAVTLSNTGGSPLAISAVTLAGNNPGDFALDTSALAGSVAPAAGTGFTLAFDPTGAGVKTATVRVFHSDPAKPSPFEFEIAGVGTAIVYAPLLVVRDASGAIIANGGNRDFGTHMVGDTVSLLVRVQNAGNAVLTLAAPSVTGANAGQWSLDAAGFSTTLQPGHETTFTVTFAPAASGVFAAQVAFTHDDTTQTTPFSLTVAGIAASPGNQTSAGDSAKSEGGGCVALGGTHWAWLLVMLAVLGLARSHKRRA